MRIGIFGTGGAGGYFGAQLALAGEDVTFIARGEHLLAIRNHGLRVETPKGATVINSAHATDDPAEVGRVEAVIVAVKSWQIPESSKDMRPMIGPDTIVLPLQNGVEAPTQLAEVLGASHVLGGLCGTVSWVLSPGCIRSISDTNFIKLGEINKQPSERTEQLRKVFEQAGVKVEIPPDIQVALWEKFLFVASFGGVGLVTRAPIGVIRALPETRQMLQSCMQEILAVAHGNGVRLSEVIVEKSLGLLDSLPAGATTSLQRDIADGKPSELEAWNGAVVRYGRKAGVKTPLHEMIYNSALPSELRARGQLEFPS